MTPRYCSISDTLSRLEQRYRDRLRSEARVPHQIVFGQIALEIQRERFKHENRCATCQGDEGAVPTYRFLKSPMCLVAEVLAR
jgi:hypothetical protein